jgi:phosphomannomutase
VEEQRVPDGNSDGEISNPEEPEALTMALALADKTNADM